MLMMLIELLERPHIHLNDDDDADDKVFGSEGVYNPCVQQVTDPNHSAR